MNTFNWWQERFRGSMPSSSPRPDIHCVRCTDYQCQNWIHTPRKAMNTTGSLQTAAKWNHSALQQAVLVFSSFCCGLMTDKPSKKTTAKLCMWTPEHVTFYLTNTGILHFERHYHKFHLSIRYWKLFPHINSYRNNMLIFKK